MAHTCELEAALAGLSLGDLEELKGWSGVPEGGRMTRRQGQACPQLRWWEWWRATVRGGGEV